MTTNIWLGNSIANNKSIQIAPGVYTGPFSIGLANALFSYSAWNAAQIVSDWNSSSDPAISEIGASVASPGSTAVIFTANAAGRDFEITCTIPTGITTYSSSTFQTLELIPAASGGTFTLTVDGQTTGNISYSSNPITFASNIQTAIAALSGFGSTDVIVTPLTTPESFLFDFSQGQFIGQAVPLMSATHTSLTGGNAGVTVTVNAVGSAAVSGTSAVAVLTFPAYGTHTQNVNAVQTIASTAKIGAFTLTISGYGTTVKLPYTAGRSLIREALETIVGRGNVLVTGGPLYYPGTDTNYNIVCTFVGTLSGINVPTMTITGYGLGSNELQRLTMTGVPTSGTFALTYSGQTTSGIAYDATTAAIQAALVALSNVGSGQIVCGGGPIFPTSSSTSTVVELSIGTQEVSTFGGRATQPSDLNTFNHPGNFQLFNAVDFSGVGGDQLLYFVVPAGTIAASLVLTQYGAPATWGAVTVSALNTDAVPETYTQYNALTRSGSVSSKADTSVTVSGITCTVQTYDISSLLQYAIYSPIGSGILSLSLINNSATPELLYIGLGGQSGQFLSGTEVVLPVAAGSAAYCPVLNCTAITAPYGPVDVFFQGTLADTNVAQISVDNTSLVGGVVVTSTVRDGFNGGFTPTATVTGGSATVNNILGGTFSLNIQGTIVTGLAYNITASALATAINAAFGSTVCTASGGPAPRSSITITFENAMATEPITISYLNGLQTTLGASVNQSVIRDGVAPIVAQNSWELNVCPGVGTLGISATAQIVLTLSETISAVQVPGTVTVIGKANLNLATLSPLAIEAAINEILGGDACRVTQVGHSQETINLELPPSSGFLGEWMGFWYMNDTYQIIFIHKWGAAGAVSLSISFPTTAATPDKFMQYTSGTEANPDSGDSLDAFPEVKRVVLGFVILQSSPTPIHKCLAFPSNDVPTSNTVSWRYKLLTQYAGASTNHTGIAEPSVGQVQFVWGQQTIAEDGTVTFNALATSATVDWDSQASVFQTILAKMFFGNAGIAVTGGLRGSWLSESLLDAPVAFPYQELQVTLTGNFNNLPVDEYGYTLVLNVVTTQFAAPSSFQKNFRIYGDYLTRTLPPHINRRESIGLSGLNSIGALSIGTCAATTSVLPTITAVALQAALDAMFPFYSSTAGMLPDKLRHPIYVYGTLFADGPMEFEFISGGLQQNDTISMVVSATVNNLVVGLVTISTSGVSPVAAIDANQLVTITGSPFGGTFTLTWGGHTTGALAYNIGLSALQTAVTSANFSSPTISGSALIGYTFAWAGAGGARAAIVAAASLNNAGNALVLLQTLVGGASGAFVYTELVKGRGPSYGDDKNNWSLGHNLNTGESAIVDDSPSPILYGLDMSSVILPQSISTGVISVFSHTRNRQVFDNGQQVVLLGAGTAPTGMSFGTTYTVALSSGVLFSLQDSAGNFIRATSPGIGQLTLAVSNVSLSVYSRFGGGQIGLPRIRTSQSVMEYLAQYWRAGFTSITVGLDDGDGLSLGYFDSMLAAVTATVIGSATSQNAPIPSILFVINNAAAALHVKSGDVGLSLYSNQVSIVGAVSLDEGDLSMANAAIGSLTTLAGSTVTMLNCTVSGNQTIGLP